jgi:hypothetical protein
VFTGCVQWTGIHVRHPGESRDPSETTAPGSVMDSGFRRNDDQAAGFRLSPPSAGSTRRSRLDGRVKPGHGE